jgi:hypothetical protein
LYNNQERLSLNKIELSNIKPYSLNKCFNDKLSKKYDYYEYLYKKIPLIRVMIDIHSNFVIGDGFTIHAKKGCEKALEHVKKWSAKNLPVEKQKLLIKLCLLYGKCYILTKKEYGFNGIENKVELVNPKYVRPLYKNNKIIEYEIINPKGDKEKISTKKIFSIDYHSSIIEQYIIFLDEYYPLELTKKYSRPLLLFDEFQLNGKRVAELIVNPFENKEKIEILLNNSLKTLKIHGNIYHQATILNTFGDFYMLINEPKNAFKKWSEVEKITKNALSSELEKIRSIVVDKISRLKG